MNVIDMRVININLIHTMDLNIYHIIPNHQFLYCQ